MANIGTDGYDSDDFDIEEYLRAEDVVRPEQDGHERLAMTLISIAIQGMCQRVVEQGIPFVENGPDLNLVKYLETFEINLDAFSEAQLEVYRQEMRDRLLEYNRRINELRLLGRRNGPNVAAITEIGRLAEKARNRIIKAEDSFLRRLGA